MGKIWGSILLLVLVGCSTISPLSLNSNPAPLVYEGQWVVDSKAAYLWCDGEGADETDLCQTEEAGSVFLVSPLADGWALIRKARSKAYTSSLPQIEAYSQSKDLCFTTFPDDKCDPNWVVTLDVAPNDVLLPRQWGLKAIGADEVWDRELSNVPVAVIDTGVECSHPDINCLDEYDATTGKSGPSSARDENGHGTHVASTIGSYCGNQIGICGVGSGIPILACKFMGASGGGSLSDAIKCIEWAREKGAKVVNASWGCQGCYSEALLSQIKQSRDAGLLVFAAAAGNSGVNNDELPHYPSSYVLSDGYDPVVSVAAVGQDGKRAVFSNFGSKTVDIGAPGVDIVAAWPPSTFLSISGTSMATPFVSGISSILIGEGAGLPIEIMRTTSTLSRNDWGASGGIVSLSRALSSLSNGDNNEGGSPCKRSKYLKCKEACKRDNRCECRALRRCNKGCRKKFGCRG